jgi:hypothetical protein
MDVAAAAGMMLLLVMMMYTEHLAAFNAVSVMQTLPLLLLLVTARIVISAARQAHCGVQMRPRTSKQTLSVLLHAACCRLLCPPSSLQCWAVQQVLANLPVCSIQHTYLTCATKLKACITRKRVCSPLIQHLAASFSCTGCPARLITSGPQRRPGEAGAGQPAGAHHPAPHADLPHAQPG